MGEVIRIEHVLGWSDYWQPVNSQRGDPLYRFQTAAESTTPEARGYYVEGNGPVLVYYSRSAGGQTR
jgi:hypothetical protein